MAIGDLVDIARDVVDSFNASDWERMQTRLAPDAVYDEVGTSRCLAGHGEIIPAFKGWREAMPDLKGTVDSAVSTGNTVVLEVMWRGTHTGPLPSPDGPIPGTGKSQTSRSGWVLDFEGDRITRSRHYFDMLSLLQQLGLA